MKGTSVFVIWTLFQEGDIMVWLSMYVYLCGICCYRDVSIWMKKAGTEKEPVMWNMLLLLMKDQKESLCLPRFVKLYFRGCAKKNYRTDECLCPYRRKCCKPLAGDTTTFYINYTPFPKERKRWCVR